MLQIQILGCLDAGHLTPAEVAAALRSRHVDLTEEIVRKFVEGEYLLNTPWSGALSNVASITLPAIASCNGVLSLLSGIFCSLGCGQQQHSGEGRVCRACAAHGICRPAEVRQAV